MPGLNQLKKFSEDILQMGKEPERRRIKGESVPRIPFPQNASEADDSGQFILGLPQEGDFTSETAGSTSSASSSDDEEIDIDALLANALGGQSAQPDAPADPAPLTANPGDQSSLDDNLFGDISDIGSSDGALDALADFEADTSALFSDPAIDDLTAAEPIPDAAPADTGDAASFDALSDFDMAAPAADFDLSDFAAPEPAAADDFAMPDFDMAEPAASESADTGLGDLGNLGDFEMPDFGAADFATDTAGTDTSGTTGFDDFSFGADDVATAGSADSASLDALADFGQADETPAASAINDEFAISDDTQLMDMNADIPDGLQEGPGIESDPFAGMGELDFGSSDGDGSSDFDLDTGSDFVTDSDAGDFNEPAPAETDSFDIGDLGDVSFDEPVASENAASEEAPSDFSTGPSSDLNEIGELDEIGDFEGTDSLPASGSDDGGFSMPDFDLGGSSTGGSDDFDLPPVDGLDVMDIPGEPDSSSGAGSSDDDFSIPGFSDFDMISEDAGPAKVEEKVSQKKKDEPAPLRTELTDSEYKAFLENLDYYPLNVRVALQDMIVKNEFTDDAVMDVINKVIKKIPARQLAAHLEKLLDISLPVPINYEKRTAAEYEAYKQSLSYQLRNKIIPIAIASFFSLLLCTLFGWLIAKFVVTPVKAELLYKEGYELISNGLYPQSEQKFVEAVSYKAKKKWYFTYARSYRDARQYDRAAQMYTALMKRFDGKYNQDLTAGLEYANMELYDRSNYEEAERVVRREILDYHLDDPQGMLLLGDVYLEWATNTEADEEAKEKGVEKDERDKRFDKALYAYEDLMYVHGQTDLHLSRMLRYYMRTDQISKVLELKSYFYPKLQKKPEKVMENKDLVELSGYLLDKMFGYLSPKNEYLRAYIEDVRDLLEIAVKSCEKTGDMESYPEAVYNYGRYFVETENPNSAITVLQRAAELLEEAPKKSHKRTLYTVNTYRLLGEIYSNQQKYLDAESMYAEGLTLFEYEKKNNALKPDENVGLLYADMADIDYFLSGNYDAALRNYEMAIDNMNDTPSIRYRVGWIQYMNGNYSEALGSFIKVVTDKPSEKNALFALGNTLAFRNSTSAAAGYYEKLLDGLNLEIQRADVSLSRVQDIDQEDLFTLYMKATNNLGVALSQVATQTSDSQMNARAISQFSRSIQAYDALHRNPETYTRLAGSNLAEMNLKYLTVPGSSYEPEYYSELSRVLTDELMLRQADE